MDSENYPRHLLLSHGQVVREGDELSHVEEGFEEHPGAVIYTARTKSIEAERQKVVGPEHLRVGKRRSLYLTEPTSRLARTRGSDVSMTTLMTLVCERYEALVADRILNLYPDPSELPRDLEIARGHGSSLAAILARTRDGRLEVADAIALQEILERVERIEQTQDVSVYSAIRIAVQQLKEVLSAASQGHRSR